MKIEGFDVVLEGIGEEEFCKLLSQAVVELTMV